MNYMCIFESNVNINTRMYTMRVLVFLLLASISVSVNAQSRELSTYYDNGNLKSRYEYSNSQTYAFTNFFPSEKVMESGSFVNGKKDGLWITFDETGVKTAEALYKLGEKTGEWRIFDKLGKLTYKITNQSNRIIQAVNFDPDGHSIAEIHPK